MHKFALLTGFIFLSASSFSQVVSPDFNWPPSGSEYVQTSGGDSSPESYSVSSIVLGKPTGTQVALKKGLNAVNVKLAFTMEGDERTQAGVSHFQGELDLGGSIAYVDTNGTVDSYNLTIDSFDGYSTLFRMRKRPELLYQARLTTDSSTGIMNGFMDLFVEIQTPTGWTDPSSPLGLALRSAAPVPEPISCATLALGLLGLRRLSPRGNARRVEIL